MSHTKPSGSTGARAGPAEEGSPYLDAAIAIAQQLVGEAVSAGPGVTWNGDDLVGSDLSDLIVVRKAVGPDLYGGAAGIAWFLGHLAAHASSVIFAETAAAALEFALAEVEKGLDERGVSLYSGATGVALAALEVADRLDDSELRRRALSITRSVEKLLVDRQSAHETDLIGGLAGAVIGLLAIHRRTGDGSLVDAARSACEQLLRERRKDGCGCSWTDGSLPEGAPALCGLAHGMSGIGWALAETAWATGDSRLLAAAHEAFRYERGWFSRERCAWPDLREPSPESVEDGTWPGWTVAWCHGAIGIGAVRLRLYEVSGDINALAEASAAVQTARLIVVQSGSALRNGQVSDVTLCHGLGGAAELALLAHEILGGEDHRRAARRVGDLCLEIYAANRNLWTCGLRQAEHVPGLFLGLAGIGVTMMRLHDISLIGSPMLPGRSPVLPHGNGSP